MSDLIPVCCHRGSELAGGRFACQHPGLFAPHGVDLPACRRCAEGGIFCNREVSDERRAEYAAIAAGVRELSSPSTAPVSAQPAPPLPPPLPRQAWNLATSLAAFVADGLKTVSPDEYAARLAVCDACEFRHDNRCLQCGCALSLKARGRAFTCPLQKWPVLETSAAGTS